MPDPLTLQPDEVLALSVFSLRHRARLKTLSNTEIGQMLRDQAVIGSDYDPDNILRREAANRLINT